MTKGISATNTARLAGLFLGAVLLASFFFGAKAFAAYGRTNMYGYFHNRYLAATCSGGTCNYGQVISCGLLANTSYCTTESGIPATALAVGASDKEAYITFIENTYYAGGRDGVGAAFVIQTMRGVSAVAGNPIAFPSAADIQDWKNRIRNPNISMSYSPSTPFNLNSGYQKFVAEPDDAFWPDSGNASAYVFRNNAIAGAPVVYMLKVNCGNPIGDLPGLPAAAVDLCVNIAGDQISVPPGMVRDAAGNCYVPDAPPSINVDRVDCATNTISGTASDPDWGGEIQVHVYVGGPYGSGAPGWIVTTVGHRFTFNDSDAAGMATAGHTYYIYAIGVNASGTNNGTSTAYNGGAPVSMGPCNSAQCVLPSNFPATMGVGETYYLKPQILLTYAWAMPPYTTGATGSDYNPTMHVRIRNDSTGVVVYDQDVKYDAGSPVAGRLLTANPTGTVGDPGIGFTPLTAGRYGLAWSLRGAVSVNCDGSGAGGGGGGGDGDEEHADAGYRPYFEVVGGDILSGGDIRTWNRDNSGGVGYGGGGTSLAAIATGNIQNFVTGKGLPGGAATRGGSGLAFANSTASGTTYGGGFTVSAFTPVVSGTTSNWASSTLNLGDPLLADNATYSHAGDLTITGQLPTGKNITVVLTSGSAIIAGNTTYGAYASPAEIPRLTLVVQSGDIFVGSGVTEMHGVYSASGNFYSCASGTTPYDLAAVGAYATCRNKLTVHGAVAANRLILSRTYGSLVAVPAAGIPASSAEEFFYSPELWLAEGGNTAAGSNVRYDSYVSLPPVL
ncbi:hypothetical protein IPL85_02780 [Candidatus Saccharibacteria bacterium]|nr:MAG: hypothetical protein IPL85_02780 [Candidatus Saccharibacteria bacterium]